MIYSNTGVYLGEMSIHGKTSHLYIFTSLKQLMILLKCIYQGFIFTPYHRHR